MLRRLVSLLLLVGIIILLPAAGCNKAAPTPAPAMSPGATTMPAPTPAPAVAPSAEVPAQFAAARRTFDTHCQKCHTTQAGAGNMGFPGGPGPDQSPPQDKKFGGFGGGPGGPGGGPPGFGGPGGFKGGMMKGPNLAKVGADPRHTREWLSSYIRDPRSQKENARMPRFEGKISDEELGALADYLGSLK